MKEGESIMSEHSFISTGSGSQSNHTQCGHTDDLPTELCAYYTRGIKGIGQGCLRVNCRYFHGTEEQLAELRQKAATTGETAYKMASVSDAELGYKRPIVCLAYLSGTCHRPGCRFLHLPPHVRPLPFAICECFSRGTCSRQRCRFFHGTQEVLSRMHARGVTMYNPITNEAHDPSASLEELMRLQERTTVPLSAAAPQPPQVVYVFVNQPPIPGMITYGGPPMDNTMPPVHPNVTTYSGPSSLSHIHALQSPALPFTSPHPLPQHSMLPHQGQGPSQHNFPYASNWGYGDGLPNPETLLGLPR